MKKFILATGIATLAFVSVAAAQTSTFTMNLTVGSSGSEVIALQSWLIANGFNIPAISAGTAKGYFGSQTASAVKLYQASRSIPNTGYVGPLTRAALNGGASGTVVTSNCMAGWTSALYQGASFCLPPGFSVPGTPVTTGTGTTATGITTPGAEGLITVKLASSPISDANVREYLMIPAYGIEVKAQGSDMIVDRVLLQTEVSVGSEGSSVSNPATFIRKIYAYDGSTLLKSWDVGPVDFNKDSSDRYYVIASGLRFVVPKDTTKVITFKVDTIGVSSDQSSRIVSIQGYAGNTQNIRAVDGAGLNSYADMSGESNERDQTITTSGASSLTVTSNAGLTPKATNNEVDSTDGVDELTMQVIDVKSTTGASVLKTVCVAVNATSTAGLPSTLYLYEGSSLVNSKNAAATDGGQACFTDLSINVAKDQTKQLTVKADFATTVGGQAASTSIASTGIKFEKPDSTTASSTNSELASNDQYLWGAAPQWTLSGTPTITTTVGVSGVSSSTVSGTIVLKATAVGGAMTKPVAGDFTVVFASSTQTTYSAANSVTGGNKVINVSPSDATLSEGNTYTVTITDTVYSSDSEIGSSQPLFMAISQIDSVVGGVTITNQTWGIDTFYTPAAQLTRGTL